jgi:hypothetical protein
MRNIILFAVAVVLVACVGFGAAYAIASSSDSTPSATGAAATIHILKRSSPAPSIAGLSRAAALPVSLAVVHTTTKTVPTVSAQPTYVEPAPKKTTTPTIIVQGGSK